MSLFAALLTAGVLWLTFRALAGGWRGTSRRVDMRASGRAWMIAGLSLLLAVYFFGPLAGVALIIVVVVHEYGHVAAYRVAGHDDATFRLIPLLGGVAISKRQPRSQAHDVYITLMGPGLCLALVAVAYLIQLSVAEPNVRALAWAVGFFGSVVNLFNLLPIFPLDGGRLAYLALYPLSPRLARRVLQAIALALGAYGLASLSVVVSILGLLSFAALSGQGRLVADPTPLSPGQLLLTLAAWAAMAAAFAIGANITELVAAMRA